MKGASRSWDDGRLTRQREPAVFTPSAWNADHASGRPSTTTRPFAYGDERDDKTRALLVTTEMALALVPLIGAALLI